MANFNVVVDGIQYSDTDIQIMRERILELEADNERLRQYNNEQAERITELKEDRIVGANVVLLERIAKLEAENERLKQSLKAKLADHINGTPCEQIRHKQEVDALQAEIERLRHAVKRTQEEGRWTYGEFFEVDEEALAELDAAREGE